MKIAVHILAYNINRFLKTVLDNVEPYVDKIYIAHAEKPYGYIEASRLTKINPTKISDILEASSSNKIEIVQGDWLTEEDMRNACLDKALEEGFDWFLIQDADELYPDSSWKQIRNILSTNTSDDLLVTTWYNFWKTSDYVLVDAFGSIKGTNAGFALRCNSGIKFVHKRVTNFKSRRVIDCPCYHYGYVMSDDEMDEKLSTWSHANDGNTMLWFKYKWKNWTEDTKYLNSATPAAWMKAIRFPLHQPDFANEFSLPVYTVQKKKFNDVLGEAWYDLKITFNLMMKKIKKIIKSF